MSNTSKLKAVAQSIDGDWKRDENIGTCPTTSDGRDRV